MLVSRLISESGLAPRSNGTRTTDRRLAFATAVRVITGVHNDTADGRSDAHMTFTAGFAKRYDFVVDVADLTDGRFATRKDISHFAAGKTYGCVLAFFCHKLRFVAGCSAKLCAATGVKLDIMDNGTDGNVFDGKAVACFNIRIGSAYYHVADGNSERSDDVAFFRRLHS